MTAALLPCLGSAAEKDLLNPDLWPQNYKIGDSEVTVYQPQILEWTEYRHLKASAAIAVKLADRSEVACGATTIEADGPDPLDRHAGETLGDTFGFCAFRDRPRGCGDR